MIFNSIFRTSTTARASRDLIDGIRKIFDSPYRSIVRNLNELNITTVIDVGANVGQFGLDIRRYGYKHQIISFEPVVKIFEVLSENIKKYEPWSAYQLGLGSIDSKRTINVSGNSGLSSSLLEMNSLHLENFPTSATSSRQDIVVSTLDKQLEILGIAPQEIFLKLDVQGYESEVLKGASESLSRIPMCYLEVSITPLYQGEITLLPILLELSKYGHEVVDVFRGIKGKKGRLLQLDILTRLTNS